MRLPRKPAAIDDSSPERGAVTAHEFGQRMNDDVGAVIDRTQQDRGRHRVVDDERNSMPGGDGGQRSNIANVSGWIADALAKNRARIVVDQLFNGIGLVGFGKADADTLARQNMREQRVGRPVKLRNRDDVGAQRRNVEYRVVQRRLARRDA